MNPSKNKLIELPLESSHLSFALEQWKSIVSDSDCVIDATCGRGRDTLKLEQLIGPKGLIIGLDIQIEALTETEQFLQAHLTAEQISHVHLFHQSHVQFPSLAYEKPVALIVYNLGYLPQSDKQITTMTGTTLQSVRVAMELVRPGGLISITCYPGHEEGKIEQEALIQMMKGLSPQLCQIHFYRKPHSEAAPSLLIIKKN